MTIYANKEKMLQFCTPPDKGNMENWKTLSSSELVKKDICPSWVLPSDHIIDRCIPKPNQAGNYIKYTF